MPQAGDIKYSSVLGGRLTDACFVYIPSEATWIESEVYSNRGSIVLVTNKKHILVESKGFWIQQGMLTHEQYLYALQVYGGEELDTNLVEALHRKGDLPYTTSWREWTKFGDKFQFRLPTAGEWEIAARANTSLKYYNAGTNIAKNVVPSRKSLIANNTNQWLVVQYKDKKPNNYGLFDCSSRIKQMTNDVYEPNKPNLLFDANKNIDRLNAYPRTTKSAEFENSRITENDGIVSGVGSYHNLVWEDKVETGARLVSTHF